MKSFEFNSYGNDIVAHNKTLFTEFSLDLFKPECLVANDVLQYRRMRAQDVNGRGGVHTFIFGGQDLVLRHYYRGGMISKYIYDSYLWQGLYKSRAMNELQMLSKMQAMSLPVPIPVAAHIQKNGYLYKADIITQLIPQALSCSTILIRNTISAEVWQNIGSVIRRFHDKGCNHADLNAHNILLNEKNCVFLVDFDKSQIETRSGSWKQRNLVRLKRSLLKLKNTEANFNYSEQDFKSLMQGYNSD